MKFTLSRVFIASAAGLAVMLLVIYALVFDASRETLVRSSEQTRRAASRQIADRVSAYLESAPAVVEVFEREAQYGLLDLRDETATRSAIERILLGDKQIGEVTWTFASALGYAPDQTIQLAAKSRGQISAIRRTTPAGDVKLVVRRVSLRGDDFVGEEFSFGAAPDAKPLRAWPASDPTDHRTFQTPAQRDFAGQTVSSDLHWSQLQNDQSESERQAEVSVQKAIFLPDGGFAGVLRVGLIAAELGPRVQMRIASEKGADPHRIFLCDTEGRLVTPLSPEDRLVEMGDDLRIAPHSPPAEIAFALSKLASDAGSLRQFKVGGRMYLCTFRPLAGTQDWMVGIVVPRDFYLQGLVGIRNRLMITMLCLLAVAGGVGAWIVYAVREAHGRVFAETARMNVFEFQPSEKRSRFADIHQILVSIEGAKTAMRAMGKYVPLDLVKRLYRERREPILGAESIEVSIMFTDIKDFTAYSEALEPARLADALGRYLDVMAGVIQGEAQGTIDKYIGDAIMALWNAPEPTNNHSEKACLAALRCQEAGRTLFASAEWNGLPPFLTRFGLHCGEALVGHFGAHNRLNYTAIGDAVNLASRLESLNKLYGTEILTSESIRIGAPERFRFRLVDIVAVKGKTAATKIYELLGPKDDGLETPKGALDYEQAFQAYLRRDFPAALALLAPHAADGPSRILTERCRSYSLEPPPADWAGVFTLEVK